MNKEKILYIIIAILIAGIIYGIFRFNNAMDDYKSKIDELIKMNASLTTELAKAKNDYMELSSNQQSKTEIVYVEKDSPDDADFEVNKTPPKVIVNAGDGNSYEFTPDSNSYQNIKDGKVVITEDNTLTLDIEKIVDARFKDRLDAINASHELELKEKDEIIDQKQRKLDITKKQRDFYAAGFVATGTGLFITKTFDM